MNRALVLTPLLFATGCGARAPRVSAPLVDPVVAAGALVERADADRDGGLSTAELAAVPGLMRVASTVDRDGDGRLSGAEIAARIGAWQSLKVGRVAASFTVALDGKPLADAEVELVPEPEFSALPVARGRSDATGRVTPAADGNAPGVAPGLYRVQVIHPRVGKLPARAAGLLVAPDDPGLMTLSVDITSRG